MIMPMLTIEQLNHTTLRSYLLLVNEEPSTNDNTNYISHRN